MVVRLVQKSDHSLDFSNSYSEALFGYPRQPDDLIPSLIYIQNPQLYDALNLLIL